jgi:DNA invertase Pin-like site-specific DNA recombinase
MRIACQRCRCRAGCEREDYEVVAVYTDVLSGVAANRPEYNAMFDAAISGDFDAIAIYALDRFGRDVVQVVSALKSLDTAGVQVIPVRGQIDRATPEGQMMTTIEAAFARWEKAKTKVRTRQGIAAQQRSIWTPRDGSR